MRGRSSGLFGTASAPPASRQRELYRTCGHVNLVYDKDLEERAHVREWTRDCGTAHDRDVNEARSSLTSGLAVSACGDGVRPQWESSRTGRPSVKQEAFTAK